MSHHSPVNFDSMDEVLLTPDNFKPSIKSQDENNANNSPSFPASVQALFSSSLPNLHMAPHTTPAAFYAQPSQFSQSSTLTQSTHLPSTPQVTNPQILPTTQAPVSILHLLQQKENISVQENIEVHGPPRPVTSSIAIPIQEGSNRQKSPASSVSPGRNSAPSNSSTSPERWAGAAYMNSPDPRNLPLPAFGLDPSPSSPTPKNHSGHSHTLHVRSQSVPARLGFPLKPIPPSEDLNTSSPVVSRNSSHQLHDNSPQVHTAPTSQSNTPMGKRGNRRPRDARDKTPPHHQQIAPPSPSHVRRESKQQQFILEARKRAAQNQSQQATGGSNPAINYSNVRIASRPGSGPNVENALTHKRSSSSSSLTTTGSSSESTNAPDPNYDNMSNHLKMMLNICSA